MCAQTSDSETDPAAACGSKPAACRRRTAETAADAEQVACRLQVDVLQWCNEERPVEVYTAPCPCTSDALTTSEQMLCAAGWQLVMRLPARPASPAGMRSAALSLAWHCCGFVPVGESGTGEALLAFALADGLIGVLDLAPQGLQPKLLWAHEAHADAIGARLCQQHI